MNLAAKHGIRRFIELGPGRVLKGLAKRIDPSLEVYSLEKIADLESLEPVLEKA
jgi:[acyl-carrier-protein] S-malonyltransferase